MSSWFIGERAFDTITAALSYMDYRKRELQREQLIDIITTIDPKRVTGVGGFDRTYDIVDAILQRYDLSIRK